MDHAVWFWIKPKAGVLAAFDTVPGLLGARGGPCGTPERGCYCPQFTDVETEDSRGWGWGWGGAAASRSRQQKQRVELGLSPGALPPESQSPATGLPSTVQISYDVTVTVF